MLVTKCSECGSEEGFVMALHSLWIGPASEGFVGTWGDETCLACGAFREMQGISSSRSEFEAKFKAWREKRRGP
jgi:hypothetical protein